jgi:hypothetical protein
MTIPEDWSGMEPTPKMVVHEYSRYVLYSGYTAMKHSMFRMIQNI